MFLAGRPRPGICNDGVVQHVSLDESTVLVFGWFTRGVEHVGHGQFLPTEAVGRGPSHPLHDLWERVRGVVAETLPMARRVGSRTTRLLVFDKGKHDDQVDVFSYAAMQISNKRSRMSLEGWTFDPDLIQAGISSFP